MNWIIKWWHSLEPKTHPDYEKIIVRDGHTFKFIIWWSNGHPRVKGSYGWCIEDFMDGREGSFGKEKLEEIDAYIEKRISDQLEMLDNRKAFSEKMKIAESVLLTKGFKPV